MWAAAIYDKVENNVCISRDFFGIKPLFYSVFQGDVYFASEIKALRKIESKFEEEDTVTSRLFLQNGILDRGNWTFYKEIKRFPHVSYCIVDLSKPIKELSFKTYWTPFDKSYIDSFRNEDDAVEEFFELFSKSVKIHCRSDVEIGSCLSGGLDSSSIVALATGFNSKFSTFTTRFPEYPEIDESEGANLISDKFKTTQFYTDPTHEDFKVEFDNILEAQDEPYGSTSIFSQYMVFKRIAEEKVKVILDGQGSDEALGGYLSLTGLALNTFLKQGNYLQWFIESSKFSKNHRVNYFKGIKNQMINQLLRKSPTAFDYSDLVRYRDQDLYEDRISNLVNPPTDNVDQYLLYLVFDGNLQQLLRYEDRNSMHFSIESRVPFLEPDLISFTSQLPFEYKFRDGFTKNILRKAFKDKLPESILWQKNKLGFGSPEKALLKKVFGIDANVNGSTEWRNLIINKWRSKYVG
jgi:asparagine synthase (glutamine-hydrolysing)